MPTHFTFFQMGEMKPEKIYIGDPEDRCFSCNRNLNGVECLRFEADNVLLCLDERYCNQTAVEGVMG